MIYKDPVSFDDTDECPADRAKERCINCNKTYTHHYRWACNLFLNCKTNFNSRGITERYLTKSMIDSIADDKQSICSKETFNNTTDLKLDPSNWRFWARKSDDCPCGIASIMCDYHNK